MPLKVKTKQTKKNYSKVIEIIEPFQNSRKTVLSSCLHTRMLSCFSCVQLFVTLWTVAHQVSLSMGLSRQEYWSGLPFPPLGDLPNPGIEPVSLMSPALAGGFFTISATWEAMNSR